MHSQSKTWTSPAQTKRSKARELNEARRKICPNSPFWPLNFDRKTHDEEWALGERRRKYLLEQYRMSEAEEYLRLRALGFPPPPPLRTPFAGKVYPTNRSTVLARKTVFCPSWREGKEDIAPWPSRQEMAYEGPDRIVTDAIHRRFLGAPRVEGNTTVNWQQRALIPQFAFEEYYYPVPSAEEVFLRGMVVGEWEVDDVEGREILGEDLMGLLEARDQW